MTNVQIVDVFPGVKVIKNKCDSLLAEISLTAQSTVNYRSYRELNTLKKAFKNRFLEIQSCDLARLNYIFDILGNDSISQYIVDESREFTRRFDESYHKLKTLVATSKDTEKKHGGEKGVKRALKLKGRHFHVEM